MALQEKKDLKDLIKDKTAEFQFYRLGELWYSVETNDGRKFEFPVPIADCGNGVFKNEDKAMVFMRWIRKHLEYIDQARHGV